VNFGTVQFLGNVYFSAATAADANLEPIRIRGTHASNVLNVYGGTVGVATNDPDDTATIVTVNMFGGILNLGAGVTLTTINVDGADAQISFRSAATTFNQNSGTSVRYNAGALTTLSLKGGTMNDFGTGTITTANVYEGAIFNKASGAATITTLNLAGRLDCSRATGTITITNCNRLTETAEIYDPLNRIVFTNPIQQAAHVRTCNGITRGGGGTIAA
jgi:hypothetical protein